MKILNEISHFLKQDVEITDYNVEERIKMVNKMNIIVTVIVLIMITIFTTLFYFSIIFFNSPIMFAIIIIVTFISFSLPAKIMRKINSFSMSYDFYKREKSMGVQQKKMFYKNADVYLLKNIDTYTSDNIPTCIVEEYMSEYNYSFKNTVNTTIKFSIKHEFKSVTEGSKYFDKYSEENVLDFINKMRIFAQSNQ